MAAHLPLFHDVFKRISASAPPPPQEGAHLHLLRISLAYRGGSLPLVWEVWAQNAPLPEGHYWQTMDDLLARVAALLPPGIEVVVLADRAYDVPPMLDRLAARSWHWVIRYKAHSTTRFCRPSGRPVLRGDPSMPASACSLWDSSSWPMSWSTRIAGTSAGSCLRSTLPVGITNGSVSNADNSSLKLSAHEPQIGRGR